MSPVALPSFFLMSALLLWTMQVFPARVAASAEPCHYHIELGKEKIQLSLTQRPGRFSLEELKAMALQKLSIPEEKIDEYQFLFQEQIFHPVEEFNNLEDLTIEPGDRLQLIKWSAAAVERPFTELKIRGKEVAIGLQRVACLSAKIIFAVLPITLLSILLAAVWKQFAFVVKKLLREKKRKAKKKRGKKMTPKRKRAKKWVKESFCNMSVFLCRLVEEMKMQVP